MRDGDANWGGKGNGIGDGDGDCDGAQTSKNFSLGYGPEEGSVAVSLDILFICSINRNISHDINFYHVFSRQNW